MSTKALDLTGQRYGRLTAVCFHSTDGITRKWLCKCDCGNDKVVPVRMLRTGDTRSCGCLVKDVGPKLSAAKTKHGLSKSPIHLIWNAMISRCTRPSTRNYKSYGGRGITVCEKWKKFEGFFEDMGMPPPGMSLDRIDNNGPYCKENCRWATRYEQANNKRNNRFVNMDGERMTVAQASRKIGVTPGAIWFALKKHGEANWRNHCGKGVNRV